MGQLMTTVQLQHSTLLTLSRVACQTLTVAGVDLLQIKAAGQDATRSEDETLGRLALLHDVCIAMCSLPMHSPNYACCKVVWLLACGKDPTNVNLRAAHQWCCIA